jgi:hypothetical protein
MLTIFGEEYSTEVLRAAWSCPWDTSKKGNPYLKTDAFSITVYQSAWYGSKLANYKALIVLRGGRKTRSRREYPTVEAAKEGAFAELLGLFKENGL